MRWQCVLMMWHVREESLSFASITLLAEKCAEYALKQVEKQKDQIRRLGLVGDFNHPYLTLLKD